MDASVRVATGEAVYGALGETEESEMNVGLAAPIVQIKRSHTTSRSYDAIVIHVGGMSFSRDWTNSRDIRLAKQLAQSSGGEFWVSPDLQARVDAALAE